MSEELKSCEKHKDNPCGTLPIGRPAIVHTVSPLLASVIVCHIGFGMESSSGTQTKQAFGSCLLPYSFVTGRDKVPGGRIWNSWYPLTTALSIIILTILSGREIKNKILLSSESLTYTYTCNVNCFLFLSSINIMLYNIILTTKPKINYDNISRFSEVYW